MASSRFSQRLWSENFSPADLLGKFRQGGERGVEPPVPESESAAVILSSEGPAAAAVCAPTRRPVWPCGVFVPENYEPRYAYPLIVWLHDAGRSERDIAQVLPRISMRNYLGLAPRGMSRSRGGAATGFGWSRSERARLAFQDELFAGVRLLRKDFHIHTERIYLVGAGEGATMAWDLFLARPEWFAGLAVLGGRFPWRRRPLRRFRELREKHLLLAPAADDRSEVGQAEQVGRLMHTAGLEVSLQSLAPAHRLSRAPLRRIDFWIMQSIGACL